MAIMMSSRIKADSQIAVGSWLTAAVPLSFLSPTRQCTYLLLSHTRCHLSPVCQFNTHWLDGPLIGHWPGWTFKGNRTIADLRYLRSASVRFPLADGLGGPLIGHWPEWTSNWSMAWVDLLLVTGLDEPLMVWVDL